MATLYIRNVPDDVQHSLGSIAKQRGNSKNAEAINALRRGLNLDQLERQTLVGEILAERPEPSGAVDVAKLIRADRDSR